MTFEQLFRRYRDDVHPIFWPVLIISLHLYMRLKVELYARGCTGILLEIQWWGTIRIKQAIFNTDKPGWKDSLYAANGAYEVTRKSVFPGLTRDLQPQSTVFPDLIRDLVRSGTAFPGSTRDLAHSGKESVFPGSTRDLRPQRQAAALLPLPHT